MSDTIVDLVVIGGSAGSFTALKTLLADLPEDLGAAVIVCQHLSSFGESRSAELLARYATMPLVDAEEGMALEPGKIVFAVPDLHIMVGKGHIHLRRGAHENNFRPAIDPLFRSAAVYGGPRAIGVVLSGMMDDGAAGARAIDRTGGAVLVQSPDTADCDSMPWATLDAVHSAIPVPLGDLGAAIAERVGRPCGPAVDIPWDIGIELKIAGLEGATMENEHRLGELTPYNCPHCNGVLWEIEDGPIKRYRCHTGHAYTMEALSESQEKALDESLFSALRAHRGRASLIRQMATSTRNEDNRQRLEVRAGKYEEDADNLARMIKQRKAE